MFPLFFFLIDVSMNAVAIGATRAACSAVQRVLADLPVFYLHSVNVVCRLIRWLIAIETHAWLFLQNVPNVKVGIATFDNTLHFYNFTQAQQVIEYIL